MENSIDVYDCTADDDDIIQEEKERIQVISEKIHSLHFMLFLY